MGLKRFEPACGRWLLTLWMAAGCDDSSAAITGNGHTPRMETIDPSSPATSSDEGPVGAAPDAASAPDGAVSGAQTDAGMQPLDLTPRPPDEPGPWPIGYRTREVAYEVAETGEARMLRVAIWYPTRARTGDAVRYFGLFYDGDVFGNAPAPGDQAFPVLLYSHGGNGYAEASSFLAEHFASHGWVVIAPDHWGNTATDIDTPRVASTYFARSRDLHPALEAVRADQTQPGMPQLTDTLVVSGHSFGGFTALMAAGAEIATDQIVASCKAEEELAKGVCSGLDGEALRAMRPDLGEPTLREAIAMAPADAALLGPGGVSKIGIPVMLWTASRDSEVSNAIHGDPYWAALDHPDDLRLDFPQGGHHSFSDACDVGFRGGTGCQADFLPWREAHHLVRTYTLAFARRHALGDVAMSPWLDAPPTNANVRMQRHGE